MISALNNAAAWLSELISSRRSGYTLAREFYIDPEVFDRDLNAIFRQAWLYAGHASRIPKPGDYFLLDVAGESVVIVRNQAGGVRALTNTCRHRGSRICTADSGNAPKLVCPYHQWVYDLNGDLVKARLMPADFDRSQFGLQTIGIREICGFLFISLESESSPNFGQFARRIEPQLHPQNLSTARVVHMRQYVVDANWKLVLENSRECYHCGTGHPQYCRAVGFAAGIDSARAAQEDTAFAQMRIDSLLARGIEARPVGFSEEGWFHARRFFLRGEYETESIDGRRVAPQLASLSGRDAGVIAVVTYPNLLLEASVDYAMAMRFVPLTETTTHVAMEWLVKSDAVEGKDYHVDRLEEFWRLTAEQDWRLCEENQKGVNSRGYLPGPYAPEEKGVEQFVEWYLSRLRTYAAVNQ